MDALKNLLNNEKGLVAVLLIIGASTGLCLGRMTVDQWTSFSQWIFGAYAVSTALHGGLAALAGHKALPPATAAPAAPSAPAVAPAAESAK